MNGKAITEFPSEVIKELNYYVYRLIDPRNGVTFYVGKGKGNRIFQHIKLSPELDEADKISDKVKTIRDIISAGLEVIHIIHRHGMDEQTALQVEAALIDSYPCMTNLIGGYGSNDFGPMNTTQIIQRYKTEEAVFEHKVIMITINKSRLESDCSIYDATRFAWRIDKKKAEQADLILSVEQGIIVGVFIATEWKKATRTKFPEFNQYINGRYGFVGHDADDDMKQLYLRKRIPNEYRKKGAAYPIKYNYS
jgi:hypothetical protein